MEYPKFKVTVSCMTYNQSKYITDAMNGFTMQQTSFPFVCTIVDDASTDGEQEVIRKYVNENFDFSEGSVAYHKETDYAHITYAQHKTNKNCYFAVLYLKENHYSKHKDKSPYLKDWRDGVEYMALCEGDDYWIVPDKLEKQVNALDSNKSATFSYTSFLTVDQEGKEELRSFFEKCKKRSHSGDVLLDLFTQNFIMTLTVVYRTSISSGNTYFDKYPGPTCDYFLFMQCAIKGNAIFIDKACGCYRDNPNGLIRTRQKEIDDIIWKIYKYFSLGVVSGQMSRDVQSSKKIRLYFQFIIRGIKKMVKLQDSHYLLLLLNSLLYRNKKFYADI